MTNALDIASAYLAVTCLVVRLFNDEYSEGTRHGVDSYQETKIDVSCSTSASTLYSRGDDSFLKALDKRHGHPYEQLTVSYSWR